MSLRDLAEIGNDFIQSNPYKQFDFTIANKERQIFYYNWTFFQILELSATTGVSVIFSGAGGLGSNVVGAGVGFELPQGKFADRVEIVNESGGSLTGSIALAIGKINDQRFTASGVLSVKDQPSTLVTVADTALSSTAANILAANTARAQAFITNLDPVIAMRWGDSNTTTTRGARLLAGATLVLNDTNDIYMCSESGTPSIAITYSEYV